MTSLIFFLLIEVVNHAWTWHIVKNDAHKEDLFIISLDTFIVIQWNRQQTDIFQINNLRLTF